MRNILIISSFILIFHAQAQEIMKISNDIVSLDEFMHTLMKNNNDQDITKEYLDEYVDLFINYKLKVLEAKSLGLDKEESFVNELEMYRKQLARPYLQAKEFKESLIQEAYDRMKYDVHVTHILFKFGQETDTIDIYKKAKKVELDLKNGDISFEEAVQKYSDATYNNGDLGYFTAFDMLYNFETGAYNTNVGDISSLIRTKFGYHLIKVHDKRNALGQVKASHIMLRIPQGATNDQIGIIKKRIDKIYERLQNGESFTVLADEESQDRSTAVKGGALPWFGVWNRYTESFTNPVFSLKEIGDYSKPFLSENGWHIVMLDDKREIGSFDDEYARIKKGIDQGDRSMLSDNALLDKIKKDYKFTEHKYSASRVRSVKRDINIDKLITASLNEDDIERGGNNRTLFYLDGIRFTQDEFKDFILDNQESGMDFESMYKRFIDFSCLGHKESKLEEEEPEYKVLLNEFRDGILLFEITSRRVWTKAMEDTSGLRRFFDARADSYMWKDRVEANIYKCSNSRNLFTLRRMIWQKNKDMVTIEDIKQRINEDFPLSLEIESGTFSLGENNYLDNLIWKEGIYKVQDGEDVILVEIVDVLPPARKKLDETKGKVISDYQNYLDSNWILELRKKYPVIINRDVLYSILK